MEAAEDRGIGFIYRDCLNTATQHTLLSYHVLSFQSMSMCLLALTSTIVFSLCAVWSALLLLLPLW
jgi:hypothetical protein